MGYGHDVGRSSAGTGVYVMEKMEKLQKQALNLTPRAAQHIARLMREKTTLGLRLGVKKGGCAGMEYTMEYVSSVDPLDEIIRQDGAVVMIAPMAQMFLFGTEIDFESGLLESGFRFRNPNVSETCGCGESIQFDTGGKAAPAAAPEPLAGLATGLEKK